MKPKLYQSFAIYNTRMNRKLFDAAAKLSPEDRTSDKGAFFKSVQMTLQHILLADLIWLSRFAQKKEFSFIAEEVKRFPNYKIFVEDLYPDFQQLAQLREDLDNVIALLVHHLSEDLLASELKYTNIAGTAFEGELWVYVSHFFNHQTHHRGQATTLLTQLGIDVGVTDLPAVLREA